MRHIVFVIALMGLAGCISTEKIVGPDGTDHLLISCGQIEDCYKKATETCGRYQIVNTNSETSGSEGSAHTIVKLLVKCDKPQASP